jgi:type I restriction enzyme S subunit
LKNTRDLPVSEVSRSRYSATDTDILVVRVNGSTDLVGRFIPCDVCNIVYCDHFIRLRVPPDVIMQRFLTLLGSSWIVRRQIEQFFVSTAGQKTVNQRHISSVVLPLPPRTEQERIVAAIEEQFSRLDAGVAALERVRQSLRRTRAAVLEAAVRGHLLGTAAPTSGVDHGGVPKLPSDWSIVPVGDVAEVSGGITKNPKRVPRHNARPFLRVANVMRDQLDLREVHQIEVFPGELERLRLQRGDLLVVEGNGSPDQIGRSAIWDGSIDPCVHQNHLIRVRPGSEILPEYLNIFWNAPSSMAVIQAAASSTSGLHTLSTGKVRGIPVALPPLSVQHHIVEEVDRQLSALSALDHQVGIAEARASVLRAAILAAAFSGNLTPQDPRDEPASVLLERIAAERVASNGHERTRGRKPRMLREEATI